MDNAPFHKQAEMHIALDAEWPALFYLPAYSTELNPIQKKWAHLKLLRRKIGGSVDALFQKQLTHYISD